MNIVSLIIAIISGIAGGNIAGNSMPDKYNLGGLGNSIAGLIGGGAGQWILNILGILASTGAATGMGGGPETHAAASNLDIGSIIGSIVSGGVGGGVLTGIVGLIKDAIQKNK